MFGTDLATLHIDLEEARLALEEGVTKANRAKGEEILTRWGQVKYAKGMADALRFLGQIDYRQGNSEKALELYLSALAVYPFEDHPNNRYFRTIVHELIRSLDVNTYNKYIRQFQLSAEERQGYFRSLNNVRADRSTDIRRIFSEFRSPTW